MFSRWIFDLLPWRLFAILLLALVVTLGQDQGPGQIWSWWFPTTNPPY
ncbi:hypothetical protein JC607_22295 [Paracoccus sp. IB05]|nr:hypothetical protein [Paracoccus sp. IB05]